MASSLYICYFGVREPLVQTQVIPYLRELVKGGHRISLLTFEPTALSPDEQDEIRRELGGQGIAWHQLKYHKRFSAVATAWDVLQGARFIRRFISRKKPDILHGRVHVPTLMAAIARKLSRHKPKLLFDIRGFMPEEYTDAGIWPENGLLYRGAKRVERWLMKESDGFVVLTEKAREILFPNAIAPHDKLQSGEKAEPLGASNGTSAGWTDDRGRPVEVIPCCVDFELRFAESGTRQRESMRRKLGIENRFVITHVGALGGLYLTEEIADFLAVAKFVRPDTFALFLTQSDPDKIVPLLEKRGFGKSDYFVGRAAASDVSSYMNASDVGLSFVRAGFATQSRSPTKIPEYLACGLPIVANRGVGDVDKLIEENDVGVLLDDLSNQSYLNSLKTVMELDDSERRSQETARREFDLKSVGGDRYRRIYRKLENNG